jgi:hypothetical protein
MVKVTGKIFLTITFKRVSEFEKVVKELDGRKECKVAGFM